jgi:hypothetical protein
MVLSCYSNWNRHLKTPKVLIRALQSGARLDVNNHLGAAWDLPTKPATTVTWKPSRAEGSWLMKVLGRVLLNACFALRAQDVEHMPVALTTRTSRERQPPSLLVSVRDRQAG